MREDYSMAGRVSARLAGRYDAWMSCPRCETYFGEWRSHSPVFPNDDWLIVESQEFEVGTHAAVTVMSGVARCRGCQAEASFDCSYGPGYWFTPRSVAPGS
jgi:hypothetical protein